MPNVTAPTSTPSPGSQLEIKRMETIRKFYRGEIEFDAFVASEEAYRYARTANRSSNTPSR